MVSPMVVCPRDANASTQIISRENTVQQFLLLTFCLVALLTKIEFTNARAMRGFINHVIHPIWMTYRVTR